MGPTTEELLQQGREELEELEAHEALLKLRETNRHVEQWLWREQYLDLVRGALPLAIVPYLSLNSVEWSGYKEPNKLDVLGDIVVVSYPDLAPIQVRLGRERERTSTMCRRSLNPNITTTMNGTRGDGLYIKDAPRSVPRASQRTACRWPWQWRNGASRSSMHCKRCRVQLLCFVMANLSMWMMWTIAASSTRSGSRTWCMGTLWKS